MFIAIIGIEAIMRQMRRQSARNKFSWKHVSLRFMRFFKCVFLQVAKRLLKLLKCVKE